MDATEQTPTPPKVPRRKALVQMDRCAPIFTSRLLKPYSADLDLVTWHATATWGEATTGQPRSRAPTSLKRKIEQI